MMTTPTRDFYHGKPVKSPSTYQIAQVHEWGLNYGGATHGFVGQSHSCCGHEFHVWFMASSYDTG